MRIHPLPLRALALLAILAWGPCPVAAAELVAASATSDAEASLVAISLTGDARGGVVAATVTGDAEGAASFSYNGFARGWLAAFSPAGSYCSGEGPSTADRACATGPLHPSSRFDDVVESAALLIQSPSPDAASPPDACAAVPGGAIAPAFDRDGPATKEMRTETIF